MPTTTDRLFESGELTHDRWINELSVLLRAREFVETPLQYFRRHGSNTSESPHHNPLGTRSMELVRDRRSRAPVHAWSLRIDVLDLFSAWISDNDFALRRLGCPVTEALRAIDEERASRLARLQLVSRPFPRRLEGAMRLWARGGYGYFNGWKSALNDLLRPPVRNSPQAGE